MGKAATRHFIVTVSGISGTFARFTGGDTTAEITKVRDGGNPIADVIMGPREHGNVTLGRPFDPLRDLDVVQTNRPNVGNCQKTFTISVQATDCDMYPLGRPDLYTGYLIRVAPPESNADGSDPAMFEMEFAVQSHVRGAPAASR